MTLRRIWIPSPCYHGRSVSGVRLIVLHTAEGARTYQDLGHFFQNYNNQVSSHVGADDTLGTIGEYVSRGNAAWTQANYNNVAVALELCGFAAWTTSEWKNQHHNMLQNAADWIAEESAKLGIPITKLSNSQAQGGGRGVCQHVNLGAGGSNHVDCGPGFPMDYVLDLARGQSPSTPDTGGKLAMSNVEIPPGSGYTDITFPYGATYIRIWGTGSGGNESASFTLDWRGENITGDNPDGSCDGNHISQWKIPPDVRAVRLKRRDNGSFPLSVSIG